MNNSFLGAESEPIPEQTKEWLRVEESRIVKILEALTAISSSKEWQVLKTEIFDNSVNILERDIQTEAKKEDVKPTVLNRLAGELKWAERYADLSKLEQQYKGLLKSIRIKLYGN